MVISMTSELHYIFFFKREIMGLNLTPKLDAYDIFYFMPGNEANLQNDGTLYKRPTVEQS